MTHQTGNKFHGSGNCKLWVGTPSQSLWDSDSQTEESIPEKQSYNMGKSSRADKERKLPNVLEANIRVITALNILQQMLYIISCRSTLEILQN